MCAENAGVYEIRVTAEDRGEAFEFEQYPIAAQPYLNERILCYNSFISSDEELRSWLTELCAAGMRQATGYIGRGVENTEKAVKDAAEALGVEVVTSTDGDIITVTLSARVGMPEISEPAPTVTQLYTLLPHIEYDAAKRRSASYVLALDRIKSSVAVETTDQLLWVALNGFRPSPKQGSAAAAVYERMRRVLISIMGASYTDEQKAHAVYDWLQYATTHVSAIKDNGSASYPEGLFGGGDIEPSCALNSLGMSKTYALMCRMEGLNCIIARDGDEYYNKVEFDGVWYIVDAYGGETAGALSPEGSAAQIHAELRSHAGLFIATGGELFDDGKLYYLQKSVFGGEYFDYYIDRRELANDDTYKAAIAAAFSTQSRGSVTIAGANGITIFEHGTLGAEFLLDYGMSESDVQTAISHLRVAVTEYYRKHINKDVTSDELDRRIRLYLSGSVLHISITIPVASGKGNSGV